MRWSRGRAGAAIVTLAVVMSWAAPAETAGAATVPGSNNITFFHDRWHPERTVVGSSAVITRDRPPSPLDLSISIKPVSRTAHAEAVLRNTSDETVFFTSAGITVDAPVTRNGRGLLTWTLRTTAVRSLAPGQSTTISASFDLPMPGTYLVSATARY